MKDWEIVLQNGEEKISEKVIYLSINGSIQAFSPGQVEILAERLKQVITIHKEHYKHGKTKKEKK